MKLVGFDEFPIKYPMVNIITTARTTSKDVIAVFI
jgi:hypothetical protein